MFDEMVEAIREDTTRLLLTLELRTEQPQPCLLYTSFRGAAPR